MARVIPRQPWTWQFSCGQCHALIEALAEDVRFGVFQPFGAGTQRGYYVVCPACTGENQVDANVLRPDVIAAAELNSR